MVDMQMVSLVPEEVKKKKFLTPADIIAADDVSYVEVAAWGGTLRFGSLDAGTMIEFVETNKGPAKRTSDIRIIIQSLVDEDGNRIGTLDMVEAFKKKNAKVINKLVQDVLKLNGFGEQAELDLLPSVRSAGKDPEKLKKLSDRLREIATRIDEAGLDEEKLAHVLDPTAPLTADAKNG